MPTTTALPPLILAGPDANLRLEPCAANAPGSVFVDLFPDAPGSPGIWLGRAPLIGFTDLLRRMLRDDELRHLLRFDDERGIALVELKRSEHGELVMRRGFTTDSWALTVADPDAWVRALDGWWEGGRQLAHHRSSAETSFRLSVSADGSSSLAMRSRRCCIG